MSVRRWLLGLMMLAGCPPKDLPLPPPPTPEGHPELLCAAGTRAAGYPPPMGLEVWCVRPTATGGSIKEGPSIAWHPNQARRAEGAYVDGKQNGPWATYFATGGPESQGSYKLGVKDGTWTTFHSNGAQASTGAYVDGAEHGAWQYWDEAASWRSEGNFVFGQKDGVWLEYGGSERPVRERLYREGRLVTVREL